MFSRVAKFFSVDISDYKRDKIFIIKIIWLRSIMSEVEIAQTSNILHMNFFLKFENLDFFGIDKLFELIKK